MAVTAPYSQYRKTNFKLAMLILVVAGVWFAYDGFKNEKFKAKHTKPDGAPDSTLQFHRKSPPVFLAGAVVVGVLFWRVKDKNLIADDERLVFSDNDKIEYTQIQSINKTSYETKGFFIIGYKSSDGQDMQRKVSNRTYDNLDAVLEVLVAKIAG